MLASTSSFDFTPSVTRHSLSSFERKGCSEVPKMTEFQLAAYKLFLCIRAWSLVETRYRVAKKTKSVMSSNVISLLESYIQLVHPKCPPNTPSTRSISRLSHLWSIRTVITQSRMERAEKMAGLWALTKLVEGVSGQYLVQWETLTLCSRARWERAIWERSEFVAQSSHSQVLWCMPLPTVHYRSNRHWRVSGLMVRPPPDMIATEGTDPLC